MTSVGETTHGFEPHWQWGLNIRLDPPILRAESLNLQKLERQGLNIWRLPAAEPAYFILLIKTQSH
jgi:hypothetical protein